MFETRGWHDGDKGDFQGKVAWGPLLGLQVWGISAEKMDPMIEERRKAFIF